MIRRRLFLLVSILAVGAVWLVLFRWLVFALDESPYEMTLTPAPGGPT